jgi:hypothetical protein
MENKFIYGRLVTLHVESGRMVQVKVVNIMNAVYKETSRLGKDVTFRRQRTPET